MGKPLVTFHGWNGRWWSRIKVGKAVYDAASFVFVPFKVSIALGIIEGVTGVDPVEAAYRKLTGKRKRRR